MTGALIWCCHFHKALKSVQSVSLIPSPRCSLLLCSSSPPREVHTTGAMLYSLYHTLSLGGDPRGVLLQPHVAVASVTCQSRRKLLASSRWRREMQSHLLQCTGQPATTAKNDPVENVHSSEVDNHDLSSSIQEHLLCRTEKPSRSAEMQTCKNGK